MIAVTRLQDLPAAFDALLALAIGIVAVTFAWTVFMFVRGWWAETHPTRLARHDTDRFMWVFLVPALNEAVTIRDTVRRLLDINLAHRLIVVIDDGSDDATPSILEGMAHRELKVLRREAPAQTGKAAALNHAYRSLDGLIGSVDRSRVIVVVVDADGRLHPNACRYAASHFRDATVGGVQALVRIYNRRYHPLRWLQDLELTAQSHLYQAARDRWGTASMLGNGQFSRLSALDEMTDYVGPWRDRLTEDQDLGLRLVLYGWRCDQDLRAVVEQQGPPSVRAFFRQRTRWSQGNLQAFELIRSIRIARAPVLARLEMVSYILFPLVQTFVAAALLSMIGLAAVGTLPFWAGGPTWALAVFYLLAVGGNILACIAARRVLGVRGWVSGFILGQLYAVYSWFIWPVLLRAALRQYRRHTDWWRTEREPIDVETEPAKQTTAVAS